MEKDNYPLADSLGQIQHQTVYTNQGNIVDNDETQVGIIDSKGLVVFSEDEEQLRKYIKEAISVDSLVETFNDNAHETLLKLLALQDNKHPLKKGGVGIAYRTDALIMYCKMEFTADENIVFDSILATMSTFPENKVYKIEPSSFLSHSKYADSKYLYSVFRKGTNKLKNRHLVFEGLGPDGEDEITVPWFSILRYHKGNNSENPAYIEFVPSDFFKDLALCSQLVHGAYGALEVITQLQGKYTIALYWLLENRKNYREYPNAPIGIFRLSLEDFKYHLSIPDSYRSTDIKRRALEPAKKSINSIPECDITFDYKEIKANGVIAGYQFVISSKKYIDTTAEEKHVETKPSNELYNQIKTFLSAMSFNFSDDEVTRIFDCAVKFNRDAAFMMQVIPAFKQRIDDLSQKPIEEQAKVSYLCKMIELGFNNNKLLNSFNNFPQNNSNITELEDLLLDN